MSCDPFTVILEAVLLLCAAVTAAGDVFITAVTVPSLLSGWSLSTILSCFFFDNYVSFWVSLTIRPQITTIDLKEFCELRPGLIGWCVLNLGMACKQYVNRAKRFRGRGSISLSMLLITLSQGLYVWDALYQEKAILSTMDITTDGFGYMLAFGDLAWVPFIYSFQTRYLVDHDPRLTLGQCALAL